VRAAGASKVTAEIAPVPFAPSGPVRFGGKVGDIEVLVTRDNFDD
jgi:hypothetical protein